MAGGWDGIAEHGMYLDVGFDPKQVTAAMKGFTHLADTVTKAMRVITKEFGEGTLAGVALGDVVGRLHKVMAEALGNTPSRGTEGASHVVKSFGSAVVSSLGEAGAAFVGLSLTAGTAVASLLDGLGNTNIQTQMLARTLWTTQNQAWAFSTALKATGASLQDLYLSPTLMSQYSQLHKTALEVLPANWTQAAAQVNNLQLSFKEMGVEAEGAFLQIGTHLAHDLGGPLGNLNAWFGRLNDWIVKSVPGWAKAIAGGLAGFVKDISGVAGFVGDVLHGAGPALSAYFKAWSRDWSDIFQLMDNVASAIAEVFGPLFGSRGKQGMAGFASLLGDVLTVALNATTAILNAENAVFGFLKQMGVLKPLVVGVAAAFGAWEGIQLVLKGVAMATDLVAVATQAWAAAQGGLDVLLSANPVGAVVIAVGALAAGVYELVTNWRAVTTWLGHAWDAVKQFAQANPVLMGVLAPVLDLVANFGAIARAIGGAVSEVLRLADAIARFLAPVLNPAISALDALTGANIGHISIPADPSSFGARAVAAAQAAGPSAAAREAAARHAFTAHVPRPSTSNLTHAQLQSLLGQGSARPTTIDARQTVHVHAASSPEATGMAVAGHYNRHLRNIRGWAG